MQVEEKDPDLMGQNEDDFLREFELDNYNEIISQNDLPQEKMEQGNNQDNYSENVEKVGNNEESKNNQNLDEMVAQLSEANNEANFNGLKIEDFLMDPNDQQAYIDQDVGEQKNKTQIVQRETKLQKEKKQKEKKQKKDLKPKKQNKTGGFGGCCGGSKRQAVCAEQDEFVIEEPAETQQQWPLQQQQIIEEENETGQQHNIIISETNEEKTLELDPLAHFDIENYDIIETPQEDDKSEEENHDNNTMVKEEISAENEKTKDFNYEDIAMEPQINDSKTKTIPITDVEEMRNCIADEPVYQSPCVGKIVKPAYEDFDQKYGTPTIIGDNSFVVKKIKRDKSKNSLSLSCAQLATQLKEKEDTNEAGNGTQYNDLDEQNQHYNTTGNYGRQIADDEITSDMSQMRTINPVVTDSINNDTRNVVYGCNNTNNYNNKGSYIMNSDAIPVKTNIANDVRTITNKKKLSALIQQEQKENEPTFKPIINKNYRSCSRTSVSDMTYSRVYDVIEGNSCNDEVDGENEMYVKKQVEDVYADRAQAVDVDTDSEDENYNCNNSPLQNLSRDEVLACHYQAGLPKYNSLFGKVVGSPDLVELLLDGNENPSVTSTNMYQGKMTSSIEIVQSKKNDVRANSETDLNLQMRIIRPAPVQDYDIDADMMSTVMQDELDVKPTQKTENYYDSASRNSGHRSFIADRNGSNRMVNFRRRPESNIGRSASNSQTIADNNNSNGSNTSMTRNNKVMTARVSVSRSDSNSGTKKLQTKGRPIDSSRNGRSEEEKIESKVVIRRPLSTSSRYRNSRPPSTLVRSASNSNELSNSLTKTSNFTSTTKFHVIERDDRSSYIPKVVNTLPDNVVAAQNNLKVIHKSNIKARATTPIVTVSLSTSAMAIPPDELRKLVEKHEEELELKRKRRSLSQSRNNKTAEQMAIKHQHQINYDKEDQVKIVSASIYGIESSTNNNQVTGESTNENYTLPESLINTKSKSSAITTSTSNIESKISTTEEENNSYSKKSNESTIPIGTNKDGVVIYKKKVVSKRKKLKSTNASVDNNSNVSRSDFINSPISYSYDEITYYLNVEKYFFNQYRNFIVLPFDKLASKNDINFINSHTEIAKFLGIMNYYQWKDFNKVEPIYNSYASYITDSEATSIIESIVGRKILLRDMEENNLNSLVRAASIEQQTDRDVLDDVMLDICDDHQVSNDIFGEQENSRLEDENSGETIKRQEDTVKQKEAQPLTHSATMKKAGVKVEISEKESNKDEFDLNNMISSEINNESRLLRGNSTNVSHKPYVSETTNICVKRSTSPNLNRLLLSRRNLSAGSSTRNIAIANESEINTTDFIEPKEDGQHQNQPELENEEDLQQKNDDENEKAKLFPVFYQEKLSLIEKNNEIPSSITEIKSKLSARTEPVTSYVTELHIDQQKMFEDDKISELDKQLAILQNNYN